MTEMAGQEQVVLSKGATQDVRDLVTGKERSEVALDAIAQAIESGNGSPVLVDKLTALLDKAQAQVASKLELTSEFQEVYSGTHLSLAVRAGTEGTYEVQYTQTGSEADARDELNKAFPNLSNCPNEWQVYLLKNKDMGAAPEQPLVITFTPLLNESTGLVRNGSDPEEAHSALLQSKDLQFVPDNAISLAMGAFRLAQGFPENSADIGTTSDKGDLLEGLVVRGAVRSVGSYDDGVYDSYWYDGRAYVRLGVAGRSPAE
jgi:hypothetical protein